MWRGDARLSLACWLVVAPQLVVACTGGGQGVRADLTSKDGGAPATGTATAASVHVHVRTPINEVSGAPGNNATWAAWLDDSGRWVKLAPSDESGTYGLDPHGDRWTVAFACADADRSLVAVYERAASVKELEVELEAQCQPEGELFDLVGTFGHVPLATTWLDFGYALDGRGFTMPAKGDSAPYEVLNVVRGTWDLGFGLRDEGGGPLTKIMLVRRQAITGPTTLDLDVAAVGLAPEKRRLVVSGVDPSENIQVDVRYALGGGYHGIDIGPQGVPFGQATVESEYVTFPASAVLPADRHRVNAHASNADKETSTKWRDADLVFHAAADVTAELPAALEEPRAEIAATAPHRRVTTYVRTRAAAALYEALVVGRVSNRRQHSWRISTDAAGASGAEVALTIPDLSAAEGWDPEWALPSGVNPEITATVRETPTPLGDGTSVRSAAHKLFLNVP